MSRLEKIYTKNYRIAKRLGILKTSNSYKRWIAEKRKQRRADKGDLRIVAKSEL